MPTRAVEDCLIEMFQSLGIAQAHIAAGQLVPGDWLGLAAGYPERVASLILVSPRPRSELSRLESRLLVVAGDKGLSAQGPAKLLADLPSAAAHILRDYECLPWADVIACCIFSMPTPSRRHRCPQARARSAGSPTVSAAAGRLSC